ncbi:MAG: barstar family protein [Lachnospiraceae bacterium]|nr:barstar family protein [Lachnospiraceae bacterium]
MNRRLKKKKAKEMEIKKAIAQVVEEKKADKKPAAKKETAKKETAKKETEKKEPAKKETAKKEPAKKAESKGGKKVVIDCSKLSAKTQIHEAFHNEPAFPDYQGNNLDAMFDMLTEIPEATELTVKNLTNWEAAPESFRGNIKKLLERANKENPNLSVTIE